MFAAYISLAILAASSVSGLVVPRAPKQPANWWKNLENYVDYNARYNALGCKNQHNTPFFEACCHPLLKTQSAASRPAMCNLASATTTSTSVVPSATDDDCDDGPESSSATLTSTSAAPTTTDDGDDDCEPCDDDDDDNCVDVPVSSTFAVSSTPVPASTPASSLSVSTPTPSSSSKPAPSTTVTPTSTRAPTSTSAPTSTKPATTSSKVSTTSSVPASSSSIISGGFATFFFQNGVAGACGTVHKDTELIAAIDERRYGNPGVKSSLCGKQARVINTKNNKSVVVTIADDCPTCTNSNSIDLSQGAFNKIATEDEGIVPVKIEFL